MKNSLANFENSLPRGTAPIADKYLAAELRLARALQPAELRPLRVENYSHKAGDQTSAAVIANIRRELSSSPAR